MARSDEHWVRRAVELARQARDRGDEPFGALLVRDDVVLLEARNAVNTDNDITQHAEQRLISKASKQVDPQAVAEATLYTSTEPCPMCAGAISWARVPRVVFGFPAAALQSMAETGPAEHWSGPVKDGPVLEAEARKVHEGYW
jgi:tRNA(Arg) A34 adenosine deaminase TadA